MSLRGQYTAMVKFSCFNPLIYSHKSKKTTPPSFEEMHKSLQDRSQLKLLSSSTESRSHPLVFNTQDATQSNNGNNNLPSSSFAECARESNQMMNKSHLETNIGVGEYQEDLRLDPIQVGADSMNNESILFSNGESQHLEKEGYEHCRTLLCDDHVPYSANHKPRTLPTIVKSNSVPEMRPQPPLLVEISSLLITGPQSRSSEDLLVLEMRRKENYSVHDIKTEGMQEQVRDDVVYKSDNNVGENPDDKAYDSYNYDRSAKNWIIPVPDELNMGKNFQGESSVHQLHKPPSEEFRVKRIEEWIIDLQHCHSFEETDETSLAIDRVKGGSNGLTARKMDAKVSSSIEASKRYISSLTPATTTAQLANHGLVVVPFLSAFVSLRVLNLSGNALVRITAEALPRGLHVLNLSKNSISTIEGLRELTRLRILNLSYNRILRIGHGLASCSSLKELYLAGNKISEVEGLHRLLKLNILDLRFNKISTAKCLGQLAANYNSLQAISLEGNPAQKNVGDDQLKKYLQGLLTHLAYYNRQSIKVSTSKEVVDRSVRVGAGAHQLERELRPELKAVRKGTIGVAPQKTAFSSTHERSKGQTTISPKLSNAKNRKLPPSGPKAPVNHGRYYFDLGNKISSLGKNLAMHRSRSEGNLGAF